MLYAHQRDLIESKLNTRVMDHYGMAERVAIITQCEHGNYHVNSDYSYVEVLDESGSATENTGYIVGTTFRNTVMPLIRYKLSDRVRWKRGACACGRTYPMIETIEGRSGDTVYGSHGGPISPSIITFVFKGLRHIEKSQVAQVGNGRWEIRVVPLPGYGESERSRLVKNIHELVDSELDITVVEQTDIPRTSTGKYRWILNEWTASSPDNRKDVSS